MVSSHRAVRAGNRWARVNNHDKNKVTGEGNTHRHHGVCSYFIHHHDAPVTPYVKVHNCISRKRAYWQKHDRR